MKGPKGSKELLLMLVLVQGMERSKDSSLDGFVVCTGVEVGVSICSPGWP